MSFIQSIRNRPLAIVGMLLGALIFGLLIARVDSITKQVNVIKRNVRVIGASAPCTNLTRKECAVYLLGALPRDQLRQIGVSERTLARLARQTARERERAAREGRPQRITSGHLRPLPPTIEPATPVFHPAPSPPSQPAPQSSSPPPSPPTTSAVTTPPVTTPPVKTPPIGPVPPATVPPVTVPGITVPCPNDHSRIC